MSIQVYLPAIDAWKTNEKLPVRSIDLFPAAWLEPIGGPKENGEKHKQLWQVKLFATFTNASKCQAKILLISRITVTILAPGYLILTHTHTATEVTQRNGGQHHAPAIQHGYARRLTGNKVSCCSWMISLRAFSKAFVLQGFSGFKKESAGNRLAVSGMLRADVESCLMLSDGLLYIHIV